MKNVKSQIGGAGELGDGIYVGWCIMEGFPEEVALHWAWTMGKRREGQGMSPPDEMESLVGGGRVGGGRQQTVAQCWKTLVSRPAGAVEAPWEESGFSGFHVGAQQTGFHVGTC